MTGELANGLTNKAARADDFWRMCRNIKTLFNFEPPVTDDEIRAASLQFVRKVSGFHSPSKPINSLQTNAPAKNREEEATKAKTRAALRFSRVS
jgi:hypothetical protein